jgi:hypothetical protein
MVSFSTTLFGPTCANTVTDGHYLNLPVMNEGGEIVGMVDVLKLTYATLEQVCLIGNISSMLLLTVILD